MNITRITDQRDTPQPEGHRCYWRVELDDGQTGWAWTNESALASEEEVAAELARQRIVLHHAFTPRLQAREGLHLRIERPDEDLTRG